MSNIPKEWDYSISDLIYRTRDTQKKQNDGLITGKITLY